MYCVIQKVKNKKPNVNGYYKELEVKSTTWSISGVTKTNYYYSYSGERFERPIKEAYKISIHESYRENGKVKKKQWVICTLDYYDIAEGWTWIGDHARGLKDKLEKIDITEDELCDIVYKKLEPIIESIKKDFETTEEYKTKKRHEEIIKRYISSKDEFEKIYGNDTYDYCYDVFGELRNKEYLKEVEARFKAQQDYYKSSYYQNSESNYSYNDFSGYFKSNTSTYTEEEKEYLKAIYKAAAMKLHPDIKQDNGESMKFLNKLKDEWGI